MRQSGGLSPSAGLTADAPYELPRGQFGNRIPHPSPDNNRTPGAFFCCPRIGIRTHLNAICRWHIAATSSKTGGYLTICLRQIGNRIPHPLPYAALCGTRRQKNRMLISFKPQSDVGSAKRAANGRPYENLSDILFSPHIAGQNAIFVKFDISRLSQYTYPQCRTQQIDV